jgi:hypothetical protein
LQLLGLLRVPLAKVDERIVEGVVPAPERDDGPRWLTRHPVSQPPEYELLQRLLAQRLTRSLPAVVEPPVEAVEPLAAREHVNGVVAVAASRLQVVAKHLDPTVLD